MRESVKRLRRRPSMAINESHAAWVSSPTQENSDRFGLDLMAYCEGLLRNFRTTNVDDLVSDAIVRVWEKLDSFNPKKSAFATWVKYVVFNNSKNAQRAFLNHNEVELEEEGDEGNWEKDMNMHLTLKQLISRLDVDDQEIVRLYLEGFTQEEIGEKINKPLKYVENSWLRRIMPQLKELAQKPGTNPETQV